MDAGILLGGNGAGSAATTIATITTAATAAASDEVEHPHDQDGVHC
jgi:hypothetical protein